MPTAASVISSFRTKVENAARLVVADSVLQLQEEIQDRTPVLTGRAKANWIVAVGVPSAVAIYHEAVGEPTPAYVKEWSNIKKLAASELKRMKVDSTVFITNNVGYTYDLEFLEPGNGGSWQAPNGMVRISALRFPQMLEKSVIKARAMYGC